MISTNGHAALCAALCASLALAAGCTGKNPVYCESNDDCKAAGYFCDVPTNTCRPSEAGPGDASPIDAPPDPLENGKPCGANDHCQSGHCVDSICCAGACDGTCQSCAVAGKEGQCVAVPAGEDPRKDCAGQDADCGGSCNGSGACSFANTSTKCGTTSCKNGVLNAGLCDGKGVCAQSDTSCGGYACKTSDECKTSCTSGTDCVSPASCDTSDKTCKSQQSNGTPCGTNGDLCASGNCVDGVCCAAASCPECQACNVSGKAGSCQAVADGLSCGAGETCSADKATVETCKAGSCDSATSDCAPFTCDAAGKACAQSCSDDTSCVATAYCDKTVGKCKPKKGSGLTCVAANECEAGLQCTSKEKVCCATACGGECETCAGKSACTPLPKGTKCGGPDFCVDSAGTSSVTINQCNGSLGSCESSKKFCDPYKCDPGGSAACATSCTAHSDCNSLVCQLWDSATKNTCVTSLFVCYVDPNATGSGTGDPASPYKTISGCLSDPKHRPYVAVAPGIYTEDLTFTHPTTLVAYATGNTYGNSLLDPLISVGVKPSKAITLPTNAKVRIVGVRFEGQNGNFTFFATDNVDLYLEKGALLDTNGFGIYTTNSTITLREMSIGRCNIGVRQEQGTLDMEYVTVHGSKAEGVRFESGTLKARNFKLDFNMAQGLVAYTTTVDIDRAHAHSNTGAGLVLSSNSTGHVFNLLADKNGGPGVDLTGSTVGVHMSTLVSNNGGNAELVCDSTKTALVTNSIVWAGSLTATSSATTYTGNCSLNYCAVNKTASGVVNIVQVPNFIAPSATPADYQLKSGSPCIDAGSDGLPIGPTLPTLDLGGNARYQDVKPGGQKIDIGAYERSTP